MNQEIKISFLDKVKRPNTGNKIVDRLLKILAIPLYPIILVLGLLLMVFVGIISLWQRLTAKRKKLQKQVDEIQGIGVNKLWTVFTSTDDIFIERKLAGTLPWDGGDYLYLKSNPTIPYLTDKIFGDWLVVAFDGVFLQKWNHTRNINCDLVFIDFRTLQVTELKNGLPTRHWTAKKTNSDEIEFTFTTEGDDLTYIVRRTVQYST
jgi:hypothetical protein